MLTTLHIIMEKPRNCRISVNISSLLQGVLMEIVSSDTAEALHSGGRQPYSQYVEILEDKIVWTVQTLTRQAYEQMIVPLLDEKVSSIYLRHRDREFRILDKIQKQMSYEQLRRDYYFTNCSRFVTIQFVTPTAFKSKGEYIFYPTVRLLMQSFMLKYDACSDDGELFSEEVLEHFVEHVKIVKYKLRSYEFHLEGTKVPAFLGEITLKIGGAQAFVNLAEYLVRFGEFSGVGIKCGMGMGGIRVVEKERGRRERE